MFLLVSSVSSCSFWVYSVLIQFYVGSSVLFSSILSLSAPAYILSKHVEITSIYCEIYCETLWNTCLKLWNSPKELSNSRSCSILWNTRCEMGRPLSNTYNHRCVAIHLCGYCWKVSNECVSLWDTRPRYR